MPRGRAEPWAKSILLLDPDETPGWSPALGGHGVPVAPGALLWKDLKLMDKQTSKQRPSPSQLPSLRLSEGGATVRIS